MQASGQQANLFEPNLHISTHPFIWKLENALQGKDVVEVRDVGCRCLDLQHRLVTACCYSSRITLARYDCKPATCLAINLIHTSRQDSESYLRHTES
jgi:hypothetical protein